MAKKQKVKKTRLVHRRQAKRTATKARTRRATWKRPTVRRKQVNRGVRPRRTAKRPVRVVASTPASPSTPGRIQGAQALGDNRYVVVLGPNVVNAAAELGRGNVSAGITAAVVRVAAEHMARSISRQRPPRR